MIQWPKGSTRVGEREDGTPFKTEMKADYGYIPDTVASGDEERLDIYIGPDKDAENAYVVEQLKLDGEFDEYKIMVGFDSLEDAEEIYLAHVEEDQLGDISEIPFDYLFDTVTEEREEDAEQEREELHTELEKDEEKIADFEEDADSSVIDAFVKLYKHEVDFYEECATHAQEALDEALQEAGIRAIVTSRAKKPSRLRDKLLKRNPKRNYQSFRAIKEDVVDLAGVRVALYMPADREAVGQMIETIFAPVRAPKHFPKDRGPGDSLGYVADHYLIQLRPVSLHKKELRYADTNIEIQVASVLMHAWSEVTHDLIYKPMKGKLTNEEMTMLKDLNDIVQRGEAMLTRLQESVEGRHNEDLRFELMSSLTKLAERLGEQSSGKVASNRITLAEVTNLVSRLAALEGVVILDHLKALNKYMDGLGWQSMGGGDWYSPTHPQDLIRVYPDGWIHSQWDKMVRSGDSPEELKLYLAEVGLGEPQHQHKYKKQPPTIEGTPSPHSSYLKARLALWKAYKTDD